MKSFTELQKYHEPVLVSEVCDILQINKLAPLKHADIIDATLGFGGHSVKLLEAGFRVLGIDASRETIKITEGILKQACPISERNFGDYKLVHGNFRDIAEIAEREGFSNVYAILYDLGLSSYQLKDFQQGFAFSNPQADLDMRIDKEIQAVRASDLLNVLDKKKLIEVLSATLNYNESNNLALKIIERRQSEPFKKVCDLLSVIGSKRKIGKKIHPATKVFLALRIAVNSEYENLNESLIKAFDLLKVGGRLVVISFHSGEDRIVKNIFKARCFDDKAKLLTKKPIIPTLNEVSENPRARSAILRVIEKI